MVKSLLSFAYRHPRFVLLVLVAVTLTAAPMLQRLQFDISAQSLVAKSDPSWQAHQQMLADFGDDSQVLIVVSDDAVFQKQGIERLRGLERELEQLDFVETVTSLFNVPNIREVEGYIESKPFLQDFSGEAADREALIRDARANPLVVGNLMSEDASTLALSLTLRNQEHYPGLDSELTAAIEKVIAPLRGQFSEVYQISAPYIRDEISSQIKSDLMSILPVALATLIVVLGLSMGRVNCSIVPLTSAAISIVLTMAFMAWMEIPINVLTSIVPALLIIIGSTEDVHLMAEYHGGIRSGLSRDQAVERLPVNQALAVMLAFLTTMAGFLSITISDLELLREFGWLVAFGLLVNFLVTTLFVPAYLRLFGGTGFGTARKRNLFQVSTDWLTRLVLRFKVATLLVLLIVAGFSLWNAQFLHVNNNTLAYLDESSPVRERAELTRERLAGIESFSIVLDSSIEGTFQKTRYLGEVEKIQQFVASIPGVDKTLSFADFVKMTHQVMEGTSSPQLPLEDELVQIYMEFVQFEPVAPYVTQDYSKARIVVRHHIDQSAELDQVFQDLQHYFNNDLKSSLKLTLTGDSVLNNRAADAMARGQFQSLALMLLVILILVSVLFVDWRAGLIALVPNLFPVVALFGVMGYFNIPLDTGTTMVAVIALGICVDDTIHFLSRYHSFTRGGRDITQALRNTILHEATPITTTSIALTLGFLTLTLSGFQPVVHFGALSALVMLLAMFSTFVLTPVLLSFTKLVTVWEMLSLNLRTDVMRHSPLFRGLKDTQIKQAVLSGAIKEFSRGDAIVDQGLAGHEFYVLLEGSASATHRDADGSVRTLDNLEAGDLFGEVAHLSNRERRARVVAQSKTRVLELRWDSIRQLARFHPRVSMRLYRNLAEILGQRLVDQNEGAAIANDELTGALTRPYLCEILGQEIKHSQAFDHPLSLMLLHIDIANPGDNEPGVDDMMLLGITRIIEQFMRATDVLARWEAGSFMVVLPHTPVEDALTLARNLEQKIQSLEIDASSHLHINSAVTAVKKGDQRMAVIHRLENQLEILQHKSLRIAVA